MNPGRWAVVVGSLSWLLITGMAGADFSPRDWPYYREIAAPAPGPAGFVAVPMDVGVYARSRPGLEDVRVIGPSGEEIPYLILVPRGEVHQIKYRPAILNRALVEAERPDSDAPWVVVIPREEANRPQGRAAVLTRPAPEGTKRQEFVVDFGLSGRKNNRLELLVPDRNFRRLVRVYGSDDAREWKLLQDGIFIFDYSGDVHVRELTLEYPTNIFRYLKVEIGLKNDEAPLTVQGVEINWTETETAVETSLDPVSVSPVSRPNTNYSDLIVDLGGRNLPVNRLGFAVADAEFYREVQVLDQDFKQVLKQEVIYRYAVDERVSERLTLELGELPLGRFGLRIVNHDNRPLQITRVWAQSIIRAVVFRPETAGPARLYVGNPRAPKPVYDLAQLYPKVSRELPPLGQLGPELKNPNYSPPSGDYSWMLWPVLALAVAAMALVLFRHVRQLKQA